MIEPLPLACSEGSPEVLAAGLHKPAEGTAGRDADVKAVRLPMFQRLAGIDIRHICRYGHVNDGLSNKIQLPGGC
jgi:hypothetical protein